MRGPRRSAPDAPIPIALHYSRPTPALGSLTRVRALQVVFGSDGALAGLRGTVAVSARLDGLGTGALALEGLPFEGSVRIGKRVGV